MAGTSQMIHYKLVGEKGSMLYLELFIHTCPACGTRGQQVRDVIVKEVRGHQGVPAQNSFNQGIVDEYVLLLEDSKKNDFLVLVRYVFVNTSETLLNATSYIFTRKKSDMNVFPLAFAAV